MPATHHISHRHSDRVVGDVYGERFGWRMFANNFSTDAIRNFLITESQLVDSFLRKHKQLLHIVEVGCGYGRFADISHNHNISYCGIDLISWLTQIGEWRSSILEFAENAEFRQLSIIDIKAYIDTLSFQKRNKTVVFFPFNCLGNITYFEQVLSTLKQLNLSLCTTIFNATTHTTALRNEYYRHCGLQTIIRSSSATIDSIEGLSSSGYNVEEFIALIEPFGFSCVSCEPIGNMGNFMYFIPTNEIMRNSIAAVCSAPKNFYEPIPYNSIRENLAAGDYALYYLERADLSHTDHGLLHFTKMTGTADELHNAAIDKKICPIGLVETYESRNFRVFPVIW